MKFSEERDGTTKLARMLLEMGVTVIQNWPVSILWGYETDPDPLLGRLRDGLELSDYSSQFQLVQNRLSKIVRFRYQPVRQILK